MQQLLDATERADTSTSYPPYNIEAAGNDAYRITLAVAGFSEADIDITVKENSLTVTGKIERDGESVTYLHQGIAGRAFERRFNLADYVVVSGANLENGILTIDLERQVPEALKPRKIDITAGKVESLADKAKKLISGENKEAA